MKYWKQSGGGDSKLIIINDGSTDKTYEKLLELKQEYSYLLPLTKENGGHGPTILFGYHYAIENKADYIFQTDSDGQTNPGEFYDFWNLRKKYDAIIGNRINREDGKERAFVEKVVCLMLKLFFKVNVPDANAPFRLMSAQLLNKYINRISIDYNLPNIILTMFFKYYDENILFKEITFCARKKGKNTINFKKIINIGMKSIKDFYFYRKGIKNEKY